MGGDASIQFSILEFFNDSGITQIEFRLGEISVSLYFIILFVVLVILINFKLSSTGFKFLIIPKRWSLLVDNIATVCSQLLWDSLGLIGEKFFPFIFFLLLILILLNVVGLIPYSFAVTSQLVVTLILAYTIFLGVMILSIIKFKFQFFNIFLPAGTSFYLSILLVPVEIVSYFFKPLSLAVRLFANIMAGHTLLKVVIGFSWVLLFLSPFLYMIPLTVVVLLFVLETAVSFIQAYVFTVLTVVYLGDLR